MEPQLSARFELGDVHDVEAYVRSIVATLDVEDADEREQLVSDGFEQVWRTHQQLRPGESLQQALSGLLAWRLKDRRRASHREWRRNPRAQTATSFAGPTGLAWEHGGQPPGLTSPDERRLISSRLALQHLTSEADLHDPRQIGRYRGVPSWAGLATGTAREIWATIEEERRLTRGPTPSQPPFSFHSGDLT